MHLNIWFIFLLGKGLDSIPGSWSDHEGKSVRIKVCNISIGPYIPK